MTAIPAAAPDRVEWVDLAKGFCIVMVVMMHSTLGVEAAIGETGWLHPLVEFAAPFRMPDFFLIAGLFLARRVDRPWPDYIDRKVVHFAYFYVLWVSIQFAAKAPGLAAELGAAGALLAYLEAFVQPFGTLWFIYLLPIFFVATKLLRSVHPAAVLVVAAALEFAPIDTGYVIIDEFAARFVYFYAGYALAPWIFAFAARVGAHLPAALAGVALWAVINGWFVFAGYASLPGISLVLGALGAAAIVALSVILARSMAAAPLRFCGENSIVIYLAFFLPMAATRIVLVKLGIISDIGTISLLVTMAALTGPLVLHWIVRGTRLDFLFVRPAWATMGRAPRLAPAE